MDIARCGPEDRPGQVELFEACFGKADGESVLAWRYDRNPHGRPIQLATAVDGKAVSAYACNPRRALSRGTSAATVGQTGDVMTHPEWRGKGLFSDLDRCAMEAAREAHWPVVFGLPNRTSEPLFTQKLGWSAVGRIRPWTFVLRRDARARQERLRAGRLAAWALPFAYLLGRRSRRSRAASGEGLRLAPIERFDAGVDPLWRGVAKDFDWMVQRDADYLNWRFLEAPSGRFRALGVYAEDGTLRGYSVVQRPADGVGVGYVVDLLAADRAAREAALEGALAALEADGASVARAWAIDGSWWSRELRQAGFRPPKPADFKVVIAMVHDPQHPLGQAARDPRRWYFTDGDRDDELVS